MAMAVNETGHQGFAPQINHPGARTRQGLHLITTPHRQNFTLLHRHRLACSQFPRGDLRSGRRDYRPAGKSQAGGKGPGTQEKQPPREQGLQ